MDNLHKIHSGCRYSISHIAIVTLPVTSNKHNSKSLWFSMSHFFFPPSLLFTSLSTPFLRSIHKKPQVSSKMDLHYSEKYVMNSYPLQEISSSKPSPTVDRDSRESPSVNRNLFARKTGIDT